MASTPQDRPKIESVLCLRWTHEAQNKMIYSVGCVGICYVESGGSEVGGGKFHSHPFRMTAVSAKTEQDLCRVVTEESRTRL